MVQVFSIDDALKLTYLIPYTAEVVSKLKFASVIFVRVSLCGFVDRSFLEA